MHAIAHLIDNANQWLGKAVSYATLLMALIMFAVVVLRYGFNLGWIGMQESITYLHASVFLLGAAFSYQQHAHVRVDVFYRRFSFRQQAMVNFFGALLFMLPLSLYISMASWDYVIESWRVKEGSMEPGGLPFVYLLKSMLLVFSASLFLQAISELIKQAMILFGFISPHVNGDDA